MKNKTAGFRFLCSELKKVCSIPRIVCILLIGGLFLFIAIGYPELGFGEMLSVVSDTEDERVFVEVLAQYLSEGHTLAECSGDEVRAYYEKKAEEILSQNELCVKYGIDTFGKLETALERQYSVDDSGPISKAELRRIEEQLFGEYADLSYREYTRGITNPFCILRCFGSRGWESTFDVSELPPEFADATNVWNYTDDILGAFGSNVKIRREDFHNAVFPGYIFFRFQHYMTAGAAFTGITVAIFAFSMQFFEKKKLPCVIYATKEGRRIFVHKLLTLGFLGLVTALAVMAVIAIYEIIAYAPFLNQYIYSDHNSSIVPTGINCPFWFYMLSVFAAFLLLTAVFVLFSGLFALLVRSGVGKFFLLAFQILLYPALAFVAFYYLRYVYDDTSYYAQSYFYLSASTSPWLYLGLVIAVILFGGLVIFRCKLLQRKEFKV